MQEKMHRMIKQGERGKEWIAETRDQIRVFSHYDADGITSAAIMARTLERLGKDFHLSIVKQLSDKILESVAGEKRKLVIFLDMGSGQIELIKKHLHASHVIICDHHQAGGDADERIVHINPTEKGMEDAISGSGVTYIFSKTLDAKNSDLAHIAVIGAIGDSQIDAIGRDWGLSGMNREILNDAEAHGMIKVSKGLHLWGRYTRPLHKALAYSIDPFIPGITNSESASLQFLHDLGIPAKKGEEWRTIADLTPEEQRSLADGIIRERIMANHENPDFIFGDIYELPANEGEFRDANEFATLLNACGKMGRANLGIALCFNVKKAYEKARATFEDYRREIGRGVSWVNSNTKNADLVRIMNGIYVLADSNISEHIISNVISVINHSGIFPEKPLFGIVDAEDGIKISARASDSLLVNGIKLNEIMSEVTGKLGGDGGGHVGAAAGVIPKERQEEFINMTELILTNIVGVKHGHEEQTEAERRAAARGEEERGEAGEGSHAGPGRRENTGQKMERQGLVQYLGS